MTPEPVETIADELRLQAAQLMSLAKRMEQVADNVVKLEVVK